MKGFTFVPMEAYDYLKGWSLDGWSLFFRKRGVSISAVSLGLDFIDPIAYNHECDVISSTVEKQINEWVDDDESVMIIILYPIKYEIRNNLYSLQAFNRMLTSCAANKFEELDVMKKKSPIILVCDCSEIFEFEN